MSTAPSSAPIVVAIDGPSGSGKSTVARLVAARLHFGYLDTGAMYRALTWECLRTGVALSQPSAVSDVASTMLLIMGTDPLDAWVRVGPTDITEAIRSSEISAQVSQVATNPLARPIMQDRQRADIASLAATWGGVVVEGRDITTVVAPEARVRILLTASEPTRLARRAREVHGSDDAQAVEATRDVVVRRDADDSRVSQFAQAAAGVVTVDTTELTLEQSVEAVLEVIARA